LSIVACFHLLKQWGIIYDKTTLNKLHYYTTFILCRTCSGILRNAFTIHRKTHS